MKEKIHPKYVDCVVTCACGNTFTTRSTVEQMNIEICGACHPFFTGKQKFVDTAGRVEKFQKRYGWVNKKEEAAAKAEGEGEAKGDAEEPQETKPAEAKGDAEEPEETKPAEAKETSGDSAES